MKVYRRTTRRREGCHHWITQRGQDLPENIFNSGESGDLREVYRRQGSGTARGNVNGVPDGSSDQRTKFGLTKYAVPVPSAIWSTIDIAGGDQEWWAAEIGMC
jgi:hypothetical protein